MNKNISYIVIGVVVIGIIIWGTWMKPWSTPEAPLSDGSEGEMMQQIDPPTVILQAGSAPLGENEAETGFMHEGGVKMYNGKPVQQDGDVVQFDMEVDESEGEVEIVDPKIELVDEDGNPVSQEETDKVFDEIYGE